MPCNNYPFSSVRMAQTYNQLEVAVQWQLDPSFQDLGPFNFVVEVTETPTFDEVLYTLPAGDNFFVLDSKKLRQSHGINFYYRVRLTTGAQMEYYSPVIGHWANDTTRHLFLLAKEITRREFVRYRYTGQKGWLLKRRNYGIQSAGSVDPITGAPLTDHHSDFGTGLEKGYYPSVQVSYSREFMESTAQLSSEGFGTTTQEVQKHRYVGFPVLEPYDILVTDTNQRYRYVKCSPTCMPGTDMILLQICDAVLLPPTDSIYRILVPSL